MPGIPFRKRKTSQIYQRDFKGKLAPRKSTWHVAGLGIAGGQRAQVADAGSVVVAGADHQIAIQRVHVH